MASRTAENVNGLGFRLLARWSHPARRDPALGAGAKLTRLATIKGTTSVNATYSKRGRRKRSELMRWIAAWIERGRRTRYSFGWVRRG